MHVGVLATCSVRAVFILCAVVFIARRIMVWRNMRGCLQHAIAASDVTWRHATKVVYDGSFCVERLFFVVYLSKKYVYIYGVYNIYTRYSILRSIYIKNETYEVFLT